MEINTDAGIKLIEDLMNYLLKEHKFEFETEKLKEVLEKFNTRFKRIEPKSNNPILDVRYVPGGIILILLNMNQRLEGYHKSYRRFTIPFDVLYNISSKENKADLTLSVKNGVVKTNNEEINSEHIKIMDPFDRTPVELPLNYTAIDVLAFRLKYSLDELKIRNSLEFLEKCELQKKVDIMYAMEYLGNYEITEKELEEIMNRKVKERAKN